MNAKRKNNVHVFGDISSGQTIVFGHGFGTDHTAWRFITDGFKDDYRLISYDNVGAGEVTIPYYNQLRYSKLASYADDLVDICEELDVRDALFVGHSVSGMIGLLVSRKAPEFFAKHVFMNASPRYLNDEGYIGGFTQEDLNGLYEGMAHNYHAWASGFAAIAMQNEDKPQHALEFEKTLSAVRPDIALAVSKAIFESDHRADLQGFSKESLIIQSKKDIAVPMEVGVYLNKHLINSRLEVIDATGHFPHISAPKEILRSILAYLQH